MSFCFGSPFRLVRICPLTYMEKIKDFVKMCIRDSPLAAQQFFIKYGEKFKFDITQVIGLTNYDEVSKEFRPYKQIVERLNRTFKASYRVSCGYDNFEGANYNVALWVAYYNFLRPHSINNYRVLNKVDILDTADTMPDKWLLLIYLGQKTILNIQNQTAEG